MVVITAYPERLPTGERPEPAFLISRPFQRKRAAGGLIRPSRLNPARHCALEWIVGAAGQSKSMPRGGRSGSARAAVLSESVW